MSVVIITLVAALFMQTGYFCWKLAADRMPKGAQQITGSKLILQYLANRLWMTGMLATFVGWLLFIKATDMGEISIVQPLMSVGDLFLVLIAIFYLHERLRARELVGIFLTIAGAFFLAMEAREIQVQQIDYLYLAIFITAPVCLALYLKTTKRRLPAPEILLSVLVGLAFGQGALMTELLTSTGNLFSQNPASELVISGVILTGVIAANAIGIALLQIAFQRGRAAVVIPTQLATANVVVLIGASLIFAETINPSRFLGIGLIIVGTAFLYRLNQYVSPD